MQQADLSPLVAPGQHRLALSDASGTAAGYQATLRFHVPETKPPTDKEPLSIKIEYDKTTLAVRDVVTATTTVANRMAQPAPMVILDLPIPAGFAVEGDDFSKMLEAGTIARYQVTARSVIVYLRELSPGKPLSLSYRLKATMPVQVAVPPARAYEYYNPDNHAISAPSRLVVATGA
jgi:uncharacterized protein YfaS (alpha-2-macroglobulin family)